MHCREYFTYLTLCGMLVVSREVLYELLSDSRTALLGIVEVQEHIQERRECTLVVNTVMSVETLVLGAYECLSYVLRNLVYGYGDTLYLVRVVVQLFELGVAVLVHDQFAVLVYVVCVEEGIASRFKLLKGDCCGVVHEPEHVDRESGAYDSTRYDDNKDKGKQSGRNDRHELFEYLKDLAVLFLFSMRIIMHFRICCFEMT